MNANELFEGQPFAGREGWTGIMGVEEMEMEASSSEAILMMVGFNR